MEGSHVDFIRHYRNGTFILAPVSFTWLSSDFKDDELKSSCRQYTTVVFSRSAFYYLFYGIAVCTVPTLSNTQLYRQELILLASHVFLISSILYIMLTW